MSQQNNDVPPTTFNLSDNAFRPDLADLTQLPPELFEAVQKLTLGGRHRSALEELFRAIDEYPNNSSILLPAMIAVKSAMDNRLESKEPLAEEYWRDPRLDPIFAVCSHCHSIQWVPDYVGLRPGARQIVFNPIGLQCHNCGYVVCRECLAKLSKPGTIARKCPNCGQETLDPRVYPTGRAQSQMTPHPGQVEAVIILREGEIPPDPAYITSLIQSYSRDAMDPKVKIHAASIGQWPGSEKIVQFIIIYLQERGRFIGLESDIKDYLERTSYQIVTDEFGTKVCIVKIVQSKSAMPVRTNPKTDEKLGVTSKPDVISDGSRASGNTKREIPSKVNQRGMLLRAGSFLQSLLRRRNNQ